VCNFNQVFLCRDYADNSVQLDCNLLGALRGNNRTLALLNVFWEYFREQERDGNESSHLIQVREFVIRSILNGANRLDSGGGEAAENFGSGAFKVTSSPLGFASGCCLCLRLLLHLIPSKKSFRICHWDGKTIRISML